jgi:hypothetical protein
VPAIHPRVVPRHSLLPVPDPSHVRRRLRLAVPASLLDVGSFESSPATCLQLALTALLRRNLLPDSATTDLFDLVLSAAECTAAAALGFSVPSPEDTELVVLFWELGDETVDVVACHRGQRVSCWCGGGAAGHGAGRMGPRLAAETRWSRCCSWRTTRRGSPPCATVRGHGQGGPRGPHHGCPVGG